MKIDPEPGFESGSGLFENRIINFNIVLNGFMEENNLINKTFYSCDKERKKKYFLLLLRKILKPHLEQY